ncbi:hypothetical protein [Cohnella silvisoli]|uniref:Uncharacterized protein n=1 Tax=Cohnella silvisoli TaxID=2873699 RepID=A0ABV1KVH8_9BACL|nr:hypothetical protein [Cohnella silvisoli]MCD9023515.1 hypothetical protein [Cohnella silvisoli]
MYNHLIAMMNERMNRGDVPLNLNATGLITHMVCYPEGRNDRAYIRLEDAYRRIRLQFI